MLVLIVTTSVSHAQSSGNEFAIRSSTEFPVAAPSIEPRFVTGQVHMEGLFQLDNILSSGPDYAPFSSLFAEGEVRGNVNFGRFSPSTAWYASSRSVIREPAASSSTRRSTCNGYSP
jgi:hypothetical protein